jgi:hypothetical protein
LLDGGCRSCVTGMAGAGFFRHLGGDEIGPAHH